MAEGLFGAVLGGDEDDKAGATKAGPESFAAAVAASVADHSPEVAAKTAAFFDKQIEVLEVYEDAVALAPDLPAAYYSWGVALVKHGDLVGAEAKLKDANQRGPRWADPLKTWGDVLALQGRRKEALAKYEEALRYAPNWKQLVEARAMAEQRSP